MYIIILLPASFNFTPFQVLVRLFFFFLSFFFVVSPTFNACENGLSGHSFYTTLGVWRSCTFFPLLIREPSISESTLSFEITELLELSGRERCPGERNCGGIGHSRVMIEESRKDEQSCWLIFEVMNT